MKRQGMNCLVLSLLLSLSLLLFAGPGCFGQDLNASPYDSRSLSNPYGAGSPYKSDGLLNPYSRYGSRYSSESWRNPYATRPPRIYSQQSYGGQRYYGELSVSPYRRDSISNPYGRYGSPYSGSSLRNPYSYGRGSWQRFYVVPGK